MCKLINNTKVASMPELLIRILNNSGTTVPQYFSDDWFENDSLTLTPASVSVWSSVIEVFQGRLKMGTVFPKLKRCCVHANIC